jgi:hypothetical protein
MFTAKKFDDRGARLEHTPRKSLKHLAQETRVSGSSARTATLLLKFRPSRAIVIHTCLAAERTSRVHFCSWFLWSVVEGEIHPQLTFFSDETWFHLQRYINTQNNHCWSPQNAHPSHKVLLHPVKVGVWCAVSARGIVVPLFLNETINCEIYLRADHNSCNL